MGCCRPGWCCASWQITKSKAIGLIARHVATSAHPSHAASPKPLPDMVRGFFHDPKLHASSNDTSELDLGSRN